MVANCEVQASLIFGRLKDYGLKDSFHEVVADDWVEAAYFSSVSENVTNFYYCLVGRLLRCGSADSIDRDVLDVQFRMSINFQNTLEIDLRFDLLSIFVISKINLFFFAGIRSVVQEENRVFDI